MTAQPANQEYINEKEEKCENYSHLSKCSGSFRISGGQKPVLRISLSASRNTFAFIRLEPPSPVRRRYTNISICHYYEQLERCDMGKPSHTITKNNTLITTEK